VGTERVKYVHYCGLCEPVLMYMHRDMKQYTVLINSSACSTVR